MRVIFPHNVSVTGFGIGQMSGTGRLFALSPCCGFGISRMEGCIGCGETYNEYQEKNRVLVVDDLPLDNAFLEQWATNLLGQPAKVTVTP